MFGFIRHQVVTPQVTFGGEISAEFYAECNLHPQQRLTPVTPETHQFVGGTARTQLHAIHCSQQISRQLREFRTHALG